MLQKETISFLVQHRVQLPPLKINVEFLRVTAPWLLLQEKIKRQRETPLRPTNLINEGYLQE